jgi:endo-1,4-beta-xylanase
VPHPVAQGILIFATLSCFVMSTATAVNAQNRTGLKSLADKRKLDFGTAAKIDLLKNNIDDGKYASTLVAEFNLIEPENDFKPPAVWRGPGDYNWSNLDWLLGEPGKTGWAQKNKLKVRGHVLVYARDDGYTLPGWIRQQEKEITPAQAKQYLRDYIHTVVGRYKGKVFAWDVINEAIDDGETENPYNLRDSFWYRKLGVDFLKLAFQYAHEADPKAELYINEYGAEGLGRKSDAILNLLKWLKSEKVPVTGAGMQYHLLAQDTIKPGDARYQNAQRLKEAGFAFQITELDVSLPVSDPKTGYQPTNPKDLQAQAEIYRDVLQLALSSPNCRGFQIWGFTDSQSWIPGFTPGKGGATILDSQYKPKPAYQSLKEQLQTK